jgi:hypothetical protein
MNQIPEFVTLLVSGDLPRGTDKCLVHWRRESPGREEEEQRDSLKKMKEEHHP